MSAPRETELYAPVKTWLEGLGYVVKGEVGAADVVALRPRGGAHGGAVGSGGAAPAPPGYLPTEEEMLIIELKAGFSLKLLQQAVARQAVTDAVYVAVPRWNGRAGWKAFKGNVGLCRRLGLGVLSVRLEDGFVEVHADPVPFRPRKSKARRAALLQEFSRRAGDPNTGGSRGRRVTAYRQDATRIAAYLAAEGATKGAEVARATGVAQATRMMADNHYGWFERVATGIYRLSEAGQAAVRRSSNG